jgi:hypothetical protein
MLTRLPGLPALPRGQRIEIDVLECDEIELALHARLHQVLTGSVAADTAAEDDEVLAAADAAPDDVQAGSAAAADDAPGAVPPLPPDAAAAGPGVDG